MNQESIRGYPRAKVTSAAMNVIVHGNSLTFGTGTSGTAARWPSVMATIAPLLGSGITPNNQGVAGQTIQNMISNGGTAVDANLVAGKVNVLLAWEFTNEINTNGNNAAAAMSQWVTYCNARRAAAASAGKTLRIITMGPIPASAGTTAVTRMAAMLQANVLMRANFRSYSDVFLDLAAMPPFKAVYDVAAAGGTQTTIQAAQTAAGIWHRSDAVADDFVHLGDNGYAIVASYAAQALKRVRR